MMENMHDTNLTDQDFDYVYLKAQLSELSRLLLPMSNSASEARFMLTAAEEAILQAAGDRQAAFEQLVKRFQLSAFERELLLMTIGVEISPAFAALCGQIQLPANQCYPTLELALRLWPEESPLVLEPAGNLRYWELMSLEPGASWLYGRLSVNPQVLAYSLGSETEDIMLAGWRQRLPAEATVLDCNRRLFEQLCALGQTAEEPAPLRVLYGADGGRSQGLLANVAHAQGWRLYQLQLPALLASGEPLGVRQRLLQREARLMPSLYLVWGHQLPSDPAGLAYAQALLAALSNCAVLVHTQPYAHPWHPVVSLAVPKLSAVEQAGLWQRLLRQPERYAISALVQQYDLPSIALQAIATRCNAASTEATALIGEYCREHSRQRLNPLVQVKTPQTRWDELVLAPLPSRQLQELLSQAKHRYRIYHEWGFATKHSRGLGLSALFAGLSGTGKTFAAEVIAAALKTDLYHIDLSAVVNKYIGETEKNLKEVFASAQGSGAILLFDEADALFGKRSQVKDSHDRYANLEVSFLLQQMEAYEGLSILTTNLKSAIDSAFLRRLRFVIDFPFPEEGERLRLWQAAFPPSLPLGELNYAELAKPILTGSSIQNVALQAAFLAAAEEQPVTMGHLLQALKTEYAKLQKPFPTEQIKGWKVTHEPVR